MPKDEPRQLYPLFGISAVLPFQQESQYPCKINQQLIDILACLSNLSLKMQA
eukprot:Gb_08536 [translate_table: standard]